MTSRADIFGEDFDVSDFTPTKPVAPPPAEAVRKLAESTPFKSREPSGRAKEQTGVPARAERRIYRTGRNAHFACRAEPQVIADFYGICDEQEWVMGITLEKAVAALRRELKGKKPV